MLLVSGVEAGGARRWISLGPFHLQPSEFAKLGLALVLAAFFADGRRSARTTEDLLLAGAFVVVPVALIVREPDLGTAVTFITVWFGIMFLAGLRMRVLAILTAVAVLAAPVAWTYALEDYQRARFSTFLDPGQDARGAGYQPIQARITVGSGGLTGKGFLQGTQGQYKFLPAAHKRLHLRGAGGGARISRCPGRAGSLFVRRLARVRGGATRQGSPGDLPRGGRHVGVHLPGDLQHYDVGRACAGQGTATAAHECRRLVTRRDAGGVWPHPERQMRRLTN